MRRGSDTTTCAIFETIADDTGPHAHPHLAGIESRCRKLTNRPSDGYVPDAGQRLPTRRGWQNPCRPSNGWCAPAGTERSQTYLSRLQTGCCPSEHRTSRAAFELHLDSTAEAVSGRPLKVTGRLPGEHSRMKLAWTVFDRARAGCGGLSMTPGGPRLLADLGRSPPDPPSQLAQWSSEAHAETRRGINRFGRSRRARPVGERNPCPTLHAAPGTPPRLSSHAACPDQNAVSPGVMRIYGGRRHRLAPKWAPVANDCATPADRYLTATMSIGRMSGSFASSSSATLPSSTGI